MNQSDLDKISQQLNEAIEKADTRQSLSEKFGVDWADVHLARLPLDGSPDFEAEFTRQMDSLVSGPLTTVRAFIGNPSVKKLNELAESELEPELGALVELLHQHQIVIDLLGDVSRATLYHFITEELLEYEVTNARVEGVIWHYPLSTPAYEAEMWTENFVDDLLIKWTNIAQTKDIVQHYAEDGTPLTLAEWNSRIEQLWTRMPIIHSPELESFSCQLEKETGSSEAAIIFDNPLTGDTVRLTATFHLVRSPWLEEAWEVVQTTLFCELDQIFPSRLPQDWVEFEPPASDWPNDDNLDADLPF